MSGQHVGGLSDSIVDDGRSSAREQMRRVMKPTSRGFHGKSDLGDGPELHPGHGRTYLLSRGPWCPHSDHSRNAGRLTAPLTVESGVGELPDLDIGEL